MLPVAMQTSEFGLLIAPIALIALIEVESRCKCYNLTPFELQWDISQFRHFFVTSNQLAPFYSSAICLSHQTIFLLCDFCIQSFHFYPRIGAKFSNFGRE